MHLRGGSGVPQGLAHGCLCPLGVSPPSTGERKGGMGLPRCAPPISPLLLKGPPWPLPALGGGSGPAQVPHRLHHDHPAAPGEGVWGHSSCWWGDMPCGVARPVPPPRASRHIPKDVSPPHVPRPRGLGWPSTRCGNTARMKRWWLRPKSSSRTGRGCWVSDAGVAGTPYTPHPPRAVPAPKPLMLGGSGWDQGHAAAVPGDAQT